MIKANRNGILIGLSVLLISWILIPFVSADSGWTVNENTELMFFIEEETHEGIEYSGTLSIIIHSIQESSLLNYSLGCNLTIDRNNCDADICKSSNILTNYSIYYYYFGTLVYSIAGFEKYQSDFLPRIIEEYENEASDTFKVTLESYDLGFEASAKDTETGDRYYTKMLFDNTGVLLVKITQFTNIEGEYYHQIIRQIDYEEKTNLIHGYRYVINIFLICSFLIVISIKKVKKRQLN